MRREPRPMSSVEMLALAQKKVQQMVARWRAEGMTDAEIERKLGRSPPPNLPK